MPLAVLHADTGREIDLCRDDGLEMRPGEAHVFLGGRPLECVTVIAAAFRSASPGTLPAMCGHISSDSTRLIHLAYRGKPDDA
jgi:hypothetical protein